MTTVIRAASLVTDELLRLPGSLMSIAPCDNGGLLVDGELLLPPGSLVSIAPCNKVREVARQRTMMFDDGGMNDETSATV